MPQPRHNIRWIDLQPPEEVYREPYLAYWVGLGVSLGLMVTGVVGLWWWWVWR